METTIKRILTCKLTLKERREMGEQLSARTIEWMQNETAKKEAAKEFGDRSKKLQGQMEELARAVHQGTVERDIECKWVANADTETMRLIRQDTGEEISSRPMTREEKEAAKIAARQAPLPFAEVSPVSRQLDATAQPAPVAPPYERPAGLLPGGEEVIEAEFEVVEGEGGAA
jgi:hypothetical protein